MPEWPPFPNSRPALEEDAGFRKPLLLNLVLHAVQNTTLDITGLEIPTHEETVRRGEIVPLDGIPYLLDVVRCQWNHVLSKHN